MSLVALSPVVVGTLAQFPNVYPCLAVADFTDLYIVFCRLRIVMEPVDNIFTGFFVTSFACAVFIDSYGFGLEFWPPPQIGGALEWYCATLDPLFCSRQRWLQAMLAIEAVLYPGYCIAAIIAIRRGLERASELFAAATVAYVTMNVYSVLLILAEAFLGKPQYRPPIPGLYVAFYLPFILMPVLFVLRLWSKRKPSGKAE